MDGEDGARKAIDLQRKLTNKFDIQKMEFIHDEKFAIEVHNAWGAEIESDWLSSNKYFLHESTFKNNGFAVFPISDIEALNLDGFFSGELTCKFLLDDCSPDFIKTSLTDEDIVKINEQNIYFCPPALDVQANLIQILESLEQEIEMQIGSKWRVANVRAWKARTNSKFGPNAWHVDGGSFFMRKLMIYPNKPNQQNGTLEFYDRNSKLHLLNSEEPVAVLIDSAVLLHRGSPSQFNDRPVIEITIVPSVVNDVSLSFSGQNARYLSKLPQSIIAKLSPEPKTTISTVTDDKKSLIALSNHFFFKVKKCLSINIKNVFFRRHSKINLPVNLLSNLNIGGGPFFKCPGWVNLDGASSQENPYPFSFSQSCTFPIPSGIVNTVYSSHCLEHLNDSTVNRVLWEVKRVLKKSGKLVLKLPDFEETLRSWAADNKDYFTKWGIEDLIKLWEANGVEDTLTNRASMIFCGYWNQAYGDHFSEKLTYKLAAYHGPAILKKEYVENLLATLSCHQISKCLVDFVNSDNKHHTFNHQNAWSKVELSGLLSMNGFNIESFDTNEICEKYRDIPGIEDMKDISIYCIASLK